MVFLKDREEADVDQTEAAEVTANATIAMAMAIFHANLEILILITIAATSIAINLEIALIVTSLGIKFMNALSREKTKLSAANAEEAIEVIEARITMKIAEAIIIKVIGLIIMQIVVLVQDGV